MVTTAAVARTRARHAAQLARSVDGYVPTPNGLAEHLTGYPFSTLGCLPDGARILEPSAGTGALVRAILDRTPTASVCAIESDTDRAAELAAWAEQLTPCGPSGPPPVTVHAGTFESYAQAHPLERFDAVIMNPPWAAPDRPRLWVSHVLTAWNMLTPGGRLVAVVPDVVASPDHQPPGTHGRELRRLIDQHGHTQRVDVATLAGTAAVRAGFPARVCVLRLVRPIPTRDGRPSWLLSPAPGDPVRVARLDVSPTGAFTTPVQQYPDRWDGGTVRVARYAGTCACCDRLLFAHDDGREDASLWTVASRLDAEDHDRTGPSVGLCLECGHDRECTTRARRMAMPYWTVAPQPTTTNTQSSRKSR